MSPLRRFSRLPAIDPTAEHFQTCQSAVRGSLQSRRKETRTSYPGNHSRVRLFRRGETVVFALERKPVLGTYDEFSDLPGNKLVQVYSFPEIVVEKTLAVTDGARREPQDLYDLWYISNDGHIPHREDLIEGLS